MQKQLIDWVSSLIEVEIKYTWTLTNILLLSFPSTDGLTKSSRWHANVASFVYSQELWARPSSPFRGICS